MTRDIKNYEINVITTVKSHVVVVVVVVVVL